MKRRLAERLRAGIGETGVMVAVIAVLVVVIGIATLRTEALTGQGVPEQLYQALFVATDLD